MNQSSIYLNIFTAHLHLSMHYHRSSIYALSLFIYLNILTVHLYQSISIHYHCSSLTIYIYTLSLFIFNNQYLYIITVYLYQSISIHYHCSSLSIYISSLSIYTFQVHDIKSILHHLLE